MPLVLTPRFLRRRQLVFAHINLAFNRLLRKEPKVDAAASVDKSATIWRTVYDGTSRHRFLFPASDRDGVFDVDREGAERSTERDGVLTDAQRVQHQVISRVDARVE